MVNGITKARENKKISQNDLANFLNVDVTVIDSWENDKGVILLPTFKKLKGHLNTSYEMLLYGEERPSFKISHLKPKQQEFIRNLLDFMRTGK